MTKHCRKSSHSRKNQNLWVIRINKALRSKLKKLKPFFSCNKEFYVSTEQAALAWGRSRVLSTDSLFLKAWWTKEPERERGTVGERTWERGCWKYTTLSLKFVAVTGEMRRLSIECKVRISVKCRVLVQASKLTRRLKSFPWDALVHGSIMAFYLNLEKLGKPERYN